MVMVELYIGPRPATLPPKEEMVWVTLQYMVMVLKISTTLPCSMLEKFLMEFGEVNLGLVPALLPPIFKVIMVYHLGFIVIVIK